MKAKELKRGDKCPTCGHELHAAYVPTDKEFAAYTNRENPGHLPVGADTASPEQRADLGELFVCDHCGYKTRFPAEGNGGDANDQARSSGASHDDSGGDGDPGDQSTDRAGGGRSGASGSANRRR